MRNKQTVKAGLDASATWKWHEKRMSTSCALVPKKPGLYVIGQVKYCRGLEKSRKFLYVGQTKNLWRRIREHGPVEEQKKDLRDHIQKNLENIKCWWCIIPKHGLTEGEDFLIEKLNPKFNIRIKQKGGGNHEQ